MTNSDLAGLACEDCPASIQPGRVDGVLTVVVTHAETCPWFGRVGPARIEHPRLGVLVHCRGGGVE